jgi:hypothetical protein
MVADNPKDRRLLALLIIMTPLRAICLSALVVLHIQMEVESFAPGLLQDATVFGSTRRCRSSTPATPTALHFGIPSFFTPKDDGSNSKDGDGKAPEDKKIGAAGLVQLITAGMGAPFLGDYQGVDEETGKMMFSLEANNLVDEQGRSKQTQMPYFESGWVDPEDEKRAAEGFKFPWQK